MGIGVIEISALHACNQRLRIGCEIVDLAFIEVVHGVWMLSDASGYWVVALCISFFLN